MAYATTKQNNQIDRYYTEYVCDFVADIASLPRQPICSTGSRALCIEDGETYVLTSRNGWVKINRGSQGTVIIDSPQLIGTPTAPTPPSNDNSTRIATTAFVQELIENTSKIFYATTAEWREQTTLVSIEGAIYVWSDYRKDENNKDVPGIKIGDGLAYVLDLPFLDETFLEHIQDTTIHVTSTEKEFWNNKVRCYLSNIDGEALVFTTE